MILGLAKLKFIADIINQSNLKFVLILSIVAFIVSIFSLLLLIVNRFFILGKDECKDNLKKLLVIVLVAFAVFSMYSPISSIQDLFEGPSIYSGSCRFDSIRYRGIGRSYYMILTDISLDKKILITQDDFRKYSATANTVMDWCEEPVTVTYLPHSEIALEVVAEE